MVLREFIRTIYHEVQIHESGALREVSVKPILVLSLARFSESPALLSALRATTSPKRSAHAIGPELFPFERESALIPANSLWKIYKNKTL
jgi:hypothetical protein